MADFVAVIRRAVDGLTENTPEMRAKVYEKAKSAVVRQLENMKPRPPEQMFKRQLDKLDEAIRQVEDEHSEAAPAEQDAPAAMAEPVAEEQVEAGAPLAEAESVEAAPEEPERVRHEEPAPVVAETRYHEEPAQIEEPVRHEDVVARDADRVEEPTYIDTTPFANREEPIGSVKDEPLAENDRFQSTGHVDEIDDPILAHAEPVRSHVANRVMEQPFVEPESEVPGGEHDAVAETAHEHHDEPRHHAQEPAWITAAHEEPEQPVRAEAAMPDWAVDIDREPEVAPPAPVDDEPSPQMPRAALTEADVASGFNDFLKQEFATPAVPPPPKKGQEGDFSWDAPFDDLPDLPKPVAFEEALEAKQREIDEAPPKQEEHRQKNARAELEDLIGYSGQPSDSKNGDGEKLPPEVTRAMSKLEGKSFRVQKHKKKRSFNPLPIAIGVVGALVVAGGAYGLYHYRDNVSTLVASYMPSGKTETPAETRAVDEKAAADTSKGIQDKSAATDTKPADADAKPTEVASLDPTIAPTKFTQRLLADGTEAETDAAKVPVDQTLQEGKTIAGQTDAGEQVASTDAAVPADNKANAETPALAVTQKMFLYEEQLGGSPVAVPGTVTWSVKNDTTSTGDKKQQMIEASLDVPGRKMKALISFKRNSDVSLPASHIIEVVFDLPEDFPEGNVEKVERVAFKQTEQDRGNSLIAVPAKITDDFHMVALNDDADARKANTELMKTRSWIDIPITYRNNRRALITIEKGASGTDAFDKVMAEWAALGAQVNNN
ncbi:MAG: Cell surface glycoprotein 1 Outer layer protein [Rhizobium sp.]|nr:Cell surface glycoprotein 1 Outer layer protein [Rhizobium sp.]